MQGRLGAYQKITALIPWASTRIASHGAHSRIRQTDRLLVAWTAASRPSAEIIYFHELESYINQINISIPEQSISLGRLTFGPEVDISSRSRTHLCWSRSPV